MRSPDSYTPKHLAEEILNWRSALEGERKQVTVLFADLKGSMEREREPELLAQHYVRAAMPEEAVTRWLKAAGWP